MTPFCSISRAGGAMHTRQHCRTSFFGNMTFCWWTRGRNAYVTTWAVNSEQRSLGQKKKSVLWFQIVLLFVAETNKVCWNQAFITSQPFSAGCKNSLSLFWAKNGIIIIREASKKTFLLGLCPKQRTPPTHRAHLGLSGKKCSKVDPKMR